ncbi:23436_t:CDS:2 [Cetraspora pellucida]|uniref:23436_t:CDS:1 n=1 Tax=Cetraspora pellucida TaxID=1433469 RepID=A0A9N9HUJ0_9GLOM|nr:23436_t:CDS:2 [Cetraspora pellucida]
MNKNFTDVSVDPSVKVIEEWINFPEGEEYYTRTWKAVSNRPIATVVFIHGFGEHIKRYNHVFDKFGKNNIEVFAYDQRGFGETAVKYNNHGSSGGWKVIEADITHALTSQRKEGIPQFLMGHSMGGGLTLRYACEGDEKRNLAGYISCSPWIQLSHYTMPILQGVGISFLPTVTKLLPYNITDGTIVESNLNPEYISRDPAQVEKYKNDKLMSNKISILTHGENSILNNNYKKMTFPMYIAHGSDDKVTEINASKQFFVKTTSANLMFREWEGRYHEMHNDYGNTEVIQSYIKWILEHVKKS